MTETTTMSYNKVFGPGTFFKDNTFAQLTAPGQTSSFDVVGLENHAFQVAVGSINTNVIVRVQGSVDGTNFYTMPLEDVSVAGISFSNNEATITANGTYLLYIKDIAVKHVRFDFVSETGGTSATIDVVYHGAN